MKIQQNKEEMHNLRKDKESAVALVKEGSKKLQKALLTNISVEMSIAQKLISQRLDELKLIENR